MKLNRLHIGIIIGLASALLFIPFLGVAHLFDWDEINFAECAREMLTTHDYSNVLINYQPFWEKPPLFIWLSALSMNIFGINEFAARLPDAVCGIITLVVVFNIGSKLYDNKMGLLWSLCFAASTLPQFYFKSGIIDPWFNLFIFSGIYFFIHFSNRLSATDKTDIKSLLLSSLFIGLAMLTKGPVAALIAVICIGVFYALKRFTNFISISHILLYALVTASVGGLWFLILILNHKGFIIKEFFDYQVRLLKTEDSDHGGPFIFHFIVLLIGCFPASVFAIRGFKNNESDTPFQKHFKLWMLILFWVVLILFSIVKTKIIHYSSLCYFPLTFLSAWSIYHITNGTLAWKKWMSYLLFFCGFVFAAAISLASCIEIFKGVIINSGIIHDKFAIENLKAEVHWSGWEWLIGLLFLAAIIYSLVCINKNRLTSGIVVLFISNLVAVHLTSIIIAPKIEQYSQGAAIEFYQSLQNKDCYVETLGFKSYAQYFYTQKPPVTNPNSYSISWLLNGQLDKDAYFVSKINDEESNKKKYPQIKEIKRKNGFIFYVRECTKS